MYLLLISIHQQNGDTGQYYRVSIEIQQGDSERTQHYRSAIFSRKLNGVTHEKKNPFTFQRFSLQRVFAVFYVLRTLWMMYTTIQKMMASVAFCLALILHEG